MIVRARRIATLVCGAGLMCLAQTQNAPEITTHDSPFTISTEVNLVTVPVVVRDGQGHAIGTLRQEDFRLFDKGKLQTITKFSVEKSGAQIAVPDSPVKTTLAGSSGPAPAGTPSAQPIAQNFLVWLFDDVHLSFSDLVQSRAAALRVLKQPLDPGMRIGVYTTSGHVSLDFTDDRDKLAQVLNQIRPFPTVDGGKADCPAIDYYQADRIVNQNDPEARLAAEVSYVMQCYGPPGPRQSDVAEAMRVAQQVVRALAPRALSLGEQGTEVNLGILKALVRRMSTLPGTRTIMLVSPGFFLRDDRHDIATQVMDEAIRARVLISSLGTQGVHAIVPGGTAEAPPSLPVDAQQEFERKQGYADEGIMQDLADATGGTFVHNNNDFFAGFRRLAGQPEYIYVLGFAPQDFKPDGSFHALKITLRHGAGLQLQTRRGYFAGHSAQQGEEEVKEALFSRNEIHRLPVELVTEVSRTADSRGDLAILARIDLKGLQFRKSQGRNNDTLTLLTGVFDGNGRYVTGSARTIDLKLKDATLEEYPKERMTVRTNLDVASGNYTVRLVVRDSEGQVMSALSGAVIIP